MSKLFSIYLDDIKLISLNQRHLSKPIYINFREHLTALFEMSGGIPKVPYEGKVYIEIASYMYKDIDNIIKPVHDAAEKAKIFVNDSQVCHGAQYKVTAPKGCKEQIVIMIYELLPKSTVGKHLDKYRKLFDDS
jgi:Holliday junction resolvase RusA-like endonuclease